MGVGVEVGVEGVANGTCARVKEEVMSMAAIAATGSAPFNGESSCGIITSVSGRVGVT